MHRTQLVQTVAVETGLDQQVVNQVLGATLDAVADAVSAGETVTLPGFGSFERRARAARTGRNPQTGEAMEIPAGHSPAFKAATAFRRRVTEEAGA